MKRTPFDSSRDQRIADEAQADSSLMCSAQGCPNRWSVDGAEGNGRCCSAHAWAERRFWPEITAAEQVRVARRQGRPMPPAAKSLTRAEKAAMLRELSAVFSGRRTSPRAWAEALRDREQRGELLTPIQREAWRMSLKAHTVLDVAKSGGAVTKDEINEALRMTGDLPWPKEVPAFEEHE